MSNSKRNKNVATLRSTLDRARDKAGKVENILASWLFERYDLLLSKRVLEAFVQNVKDGTPVYVGLWCEEDHEFEYEETHVYVSLIEAALRSDPESHFLYFAITPSTPTTEWVLSPFPENESLNNFPLESHQMNVIRQLLREERYTEFNKSKTKQEKTTETNIRLPRLVGTKEAARELFTTAMGSNQDVMKLELNARAVTTFTPAFLSEIVKLSKQNNIAEIHLTAETDELRKQIIEAIAKHKATIRVTSNSIPFEV